MSNSLRSPFKKISYFFTIFVLVFPGISLIDFVKKNQQCEKKKVIFNHIRKMMISDLIRLAI